jgi:serine/threonine protein kinase
MTPKTGQLGLGTPSYMAPELWDGRRISTATDVYALACVTYEILTGKKLFDGSLHEVMYQHTQVGYKLLYSSPLKSSTRAITLLKAALLSNPDERIQSPREFVEKIVQIFGEGDEEISDPLPRRRAGFDRRIWEYATNEQIEQGYSAAVARHLQIPFREFPCLVVFEDIRSPKRIVFSFKNKSINEISSEIRQIFTVIEVSDTNHRRMSPLALLKRYKTSQLQKKASDTILEMSKKTFEAAIEAWLKATIK